MKKQNVRTVTLIVCTLTYLLVGAAVFDALESTNEQREYALLVEIETEFIARYNVSEADYKTLEIVIMSLIPFNAGIHWKFSGAFYFATTVITTIGYGHSTPTTYAGKLFCMGYALTGIPLTLVMFQAIGERLNTFVAFTIIHLKRCMKLRSTEVSQTNLIIVGLGLCAIVTTGGAFMFSFYERWSYFDSLYYCLITLTTIGFGDYVALQNSETTEQNPYYIVLSLVFIFTGLTVVGAAMNLLVLRFLTMNTEDEKREEAEAQAAAQIAVRLDGDVITANGSIISGGGGGGELATDYSDAASTCSCSCYGRMAGKQTRYKVTRSPGRISHLLQMQTFRSREDVYSTIQDCGDEPQSPTRASV